MCFGIGGISTCIYRQAQQCPFTKHIGGIYQRVYIGKFSSVRKTFSFPLYIVGSCSFAFCVYVKLWDVLFCWAWAAHAVANLHAMHHASVRGLPAPVSLLFLLALVQQKIFSHVSFLLPKEKSRNTSSTPQYMHIVETSFGQYIQKVGVHGIKSVHGSHAMLTTSCRPNL